MLGESSYALSQHDIAFISSPAAVVVDCWKGSNYVFGLGGGGSSGRNVSDRATALMSPLPVATTKSSEQDRTRQGTGRRKIYGAGTYVGSCAMPSLSPVARYLSNKDTQMCTEARVHVWLTAGINLKNNNSETGS